MTLSTRGENAMRGIDAANSPLFKNDSPDDLREILKAGRLTMLRNVGKETEEELCRLMGMDSQK